MIPGSDLLADALDVIDAQAVAYYPALSRTENAVGQFVTTYADVPTTIYGSFQPVSRNLYSQYNLDLQKSYYVFYSSTNIADVERDTSSDQLVYAGKRYQVESNNPDWYAVDGWKGVLCVYINDES